MSNPKDDMPEDLIDKVKAHTNDEMTRRETEWVGDAQGMVE